MDRLKMDILIVGGGVVGSSMALLAASNGFECGLVEQDTAAGGGPPAADPRVLALTLASQKILQFINAWQQLAPADLGRFERMHVWDENGKAQVRFDSADVNQSTLGYIVQQNALVKAMEKAREFQPAVTGFTGVSPTSLSPDRKEVTLGLSDGRQVSAKLIIAADGARSKLRQLAGIDYDSRKYGQTAVASVVQTELPHERVARQRFLAKGPIAFLPMAEQDQCGVVWSTTPEQAAELLDMDEAGFHALLQRVFESRLGMIKHSGVRQSFPLQRAQARHYCADRLALVGDAAHCVHPLAGLGANLGLLDAASLLEVLCNARAGRRDIGGMTVLRKYERWRKGENFMVMMVLEGLKYLFENQTSPLPEFRNAGMGVFNSFHALKNFIIRRATGMEGDLPAIVKND